MSNVKKETMIGQKLRKLRRERDITQSQLSKITGLDQTHISHFETEERQPSLVNFTKVVKGLKCTREELYNLLFTP